MGFRNGSVVKNSFPMQETQETWVRSLNGVDAPEKEMAPHPSILAWEIPWTEEPGGLYPWGHKELDMTEHAHIEFLKVNPFNYISSKTTSSPPQG